MSITHDKNVTPGNAIAGFLMLGKEKYGEAPENAVAGLYSAMAGDWEAGLVPAGAGAYPDS